MPTGRGEVRPTASFFFDRAVGKSVPKALRAVGIQTVAHDDHYPAQRPIPDELWIAEQTAAGHLLVTKDKSVRLRKSEITTIRSAGARLLVLTDGRATRLRMLRSLMIAWPAVETVLQEHPTGPWIHAVSAGGALNRVL